METNLKSILQKHHRRIKRRTDYLAQKGLSVGQLRQKSARLLAAGALSTSLLLNPGAVDLPQLASGLIERTLAKPLSSEELKNSLIRALQSIIPKEPRSLTEEEESRLAEAFKRYLSINAAATLEDNHLNTTYGYTGEEQHLARYPGDTIANHDELQNIGMAPGLGAWGYFTPSKETMTDDVVKMEKYYIAAQTLYLPDWATRQPYLKDWYKYRKVLVINPKNGQSAVAVIGDAGPASWTGKQFGASPELMHHLKLDIGMKKGAVVVFFVDDPENKVLLGPIEYNKISV